MNQLWPTPLSRQEVRAIDRRAVERYGIPELLLMENAGRNTAQEILARRRTRWDGPAVILAGGGNNGGDGYVIARHLALAGVDVCVLVCSDPDRLPPSARTNHDIAVRMGLRLHDHVADTDRLGNRARLDEAGLVVDALLGTGFSGEVREPTASIIREVNAMHRPFVVAVDLPSGLDCDTGRSADPTIRAHLTVSFVAAKVGFANTTAAAMLGDVVVVGIGAPADTAADSLHE